jgi:hypothetical protein
MCSENLSNEQYVLIKTKTIQSMSITRVLKLLLVRTVDFMPQSTLIPEELELEVARLPSNLPPVVYSHFTLGFLCIMFNCFISFLKPTLLYSTRQSDH